MKTLSHSDSRLDNLQNILIFSDVKLYHNMDQIQTPYKMLLPFQITEDMENILFQDINIRIN